MSSIEWREALAKIVKGKILFHEPMERHTSLCVGGPAEALIIPRTANELKNILLLARKNELLLTIIGNGTKLLASDYGIPGITVKISGSLDEVRVSGEKVTVGAGFPLAGLSRLTAAQGLTGLEFAIGIPGTVGAGVVMNAGAHGYSLSDVVSTVKAMSFEGEIVEFGRGELRFGYRRSALQNAPVIVLVVEMRLWQADREKSERTLKENIQWRRKNQPSLPNAGSIFKNPSGLFAGKLIDEAGLKGLKIGGARISDKRANFIVNEGGATARDVRRLIQTAQKAVYDKYHVKLELEIRLVGKDRERTTRGFDPN